MTTALYRRYRPETFADVIGQEHVTEPLMQALRTGRVNHAYLFSGPRGCGKTTSARILARCLNCKQGPTPTPCGTCESCAALARGGPGSVDVIEIDAASHGGVDDARDLRERASFGPASSRYKIYIIDEAHMVTPQGFNALLKIVEEPPEHVKFVFATTEPEKVIGTIRSRTHHYPFRLVPPKKLTDYMELLLKSEGVEWEPGVLSFVTRAGGGSVRDSLSVLDQLIAGSGPEGLTYSSAAALLGFTDDELLDGIVEAFAAGDSAAVFRQIDRVVESGADPRRFVEDLLERLRDLIVVAAVEEGAGAVLRSVPEDQLARMREQAASFGPGALSRAADVINAGLTAMSGVTSPRLQLELMCARVLLPGIAGLDGYAARLDRMERRLDMGHLPSTASSAPVRHAPSLDGDAGRRGAQGGQDMQRAEYASGRSGVGGQGDQTSSSVASGGDPAQGASGGVSEAEREALQQQSLEQTQVGAAQGQAHSGQGYQGRGDDRLATARPQNARQETGRQEGGAQGNPLQGSQTNGIQPGGNQGIENQGLANQGGANLRDPNQGGSNPSTFGQAASDQQGTNEATSTPRRTTGGLTTDDLRRAWSDVLDRVFRIKRVTWTLLSQNAQVLDFDGERLLLGAASPGLADVMSRGQHPEVVRQALIEALGVDARMEATVIQHGQGGPQSQQNSEPQRGQQGGQRSAPQTGQPVGRPVGQQFDRSPGDGAGGGPGGVNSGYGQGRPAPGSAQGAAQGSVQNHPQERGSQPQGGGLNRGEPFAPQSFSSQNGGFEPPPDESEPANPEWQWGSAPEPATKPVADSQPAPDEAANKPKGGGWRARTGWDGTAGDPPAHVAPVEARTARDDAGLATAAAQSRAWGNEDGADWSSQMNPAPSWATEDDADGDAGGSHGAPVERRQEDVDTPPSVGMGQAGGSERGLDEQAPGVSADDGPNQVNPDQDVMVGEDSSEASAAGNDVPDWMEEEPETDVEAVYDPLPPKSGSQGETTGPSVSGVGANADNESRAGNEPSASSPSSASPSSTPTSSRPTTFAAPSFAREAQSVADAEASLTPRQRAEKAARENAQKQEDARLAASGRTVDDTDVSPDDEDIESSDAVGLPVIKSILGGTVIAEEGPEGGA